MLRSRQVLASGCRAGELCDGVVEKTDAAGPCAPMCSSILMAGCSSPYANAASPECVLMRPVAFSRCRMPISSACSRSSATVKPPANITCRGTCRKPFPGHTPLASRPGTASEERNAGIPGWIAATGSIASTARSTCSPGEGARGARDASGHLGEVPIDRDQRTFVLPPYVEAMRRSTPGQFEPLSDAEVPAAPETVIVERKPKRTRKRK